MTLTESLVSSFILTLLASQSGRVFTHAIQAVGDTKLRDQVTLSISRDLEQVRNTVNLWQVVTSNLDTNGLPFNGEMAYQPSAEMCADNTLAADLISDSDAMGDAGTLTKTNSTTKRVKTIAINGSGMDLIRTISSDASNENLLRVHYSVDATTLQHSDQSTTLEMPSQAWCP
jgi:hypothetical protein